MEIQSKECLMFGGGFWNAFDERLQKRTLDKKPTHTYIYIFRDRWAECYRNVMDGQQLLHDIKCLLFLDSRSKAAFSNQVDPLDRHKLCKEAPRCFVSGAIRLSS